MNEQEVYDPFGNLVKLNQEMCSDLKQDFQEDEIYDDARTVVAKPALSFKMLHDHNTMYYFRAIGWNKTMLIAAEQTDGHYTAISCTINPPKETIKELMDKGERLI